MINTSRIVPVTGIDLLSLYGLILKEVLGVSSASLTKVDASNPEGDFAITAAANALICSEPAKKIDFAAAVTSATLYFVAAYDYEGFTLAGVATETAGADVEADGKTLYSATLSSGTVTIAKVGF